MQRSAIGLTALGIAVAAAAFVQSAPVATKSLKSAAGHSYGLRFANAGSSSAPALFVVLDGEQFFEPALATARSLVAEGAIPPMLVVGVTVEAADGQALNARLRDYTDEVAQELRPERIRREGVQTGGVARFIEFITQVLLPTLAARHNVNPGCSTVFGHSLGGLAVLHMLAARPASFSAYAASSPSIWWGGRSVLKRLEQLPARASAQRPRLLLTVGALEQPEPALASDAAAEPPNFQMIDNARRAVRLIHAQPRAVTTSFQMIAGRTHSTAAPDAIRNALLMSAQCRQFVRGKRPPEKTGNVEGGGE